VSDHFGEVNQRQTGFELFDNEGVAEVVDFGSLDPSDAEVAVDGGSDVADKEGVAGFGDEEGGVLGFGAFFDVGLDRFLGRFVEGDASGVVRFVGSDLEIAFFEGDVLELDASKFADSKTSLKKEFDDGIHANVIAASIAKGAILEGRENSRRSYLIFGVADRVSRGRGDNTLRNEEFEE